MAEMTRVDQESQGGGFSSEVFFGGIITLLEGLYVPSKAEQISGSHYNAMVNLLSGIAQRIAATCSLRVYRDSDDADDEFSVAAGSIDLPGGMRCTYAGETALGTLATGVNYIWAVIGPTITIGFGAALPDLGSGPPIIVLADLTQPADGPWKPQHLVHRVGVQAVTPPRSAVRVIRLNFTDDDDGAIALESVPAGALILRATVVVLTAFDGTAPTLDIGDAGDPDRLVAAADVDLKTAGVYELSPGYEYSALTALTAALDIDGSTTGAAAIVIEVV
jgi:hypothetical protein